MLLDAIHGAATAVAALAQPSWPHATVYMIFIVYGAFALGWHGLVLAELAHSAPTEQAGVIAGAFSSISFLGAVAGPLIFSAALPAIGYSGSFLLIVVVTAAAGAVLLVRQRLSAPVEL